MALHHAGSSFLCPQTSDLQLVRDALRSLRNSFSGHDPQHHTIDSLEQGISSLMERLRAMETQRKQERKVPLPPGLPRELGGDPRVDVDEGITKRYVRSC